MKNTWNQIAARAAAGLALLGMLATAQAQVGFGSGGVLGGTPADQDVGSEFDFTFPGGSPQELVEQLEAQGGEPVNAIIPEELAKLRLPKLNLRTVSVRDVLNSLNLLASLQQARWSWIQAPTTRSAIWILAEDPKPAAVDQQTGLPRALRPDPRKQPSVQVFNASKLLQKFSVDDLATVVNRSWKLGQSDSGAPEDEASLPTLQFHEETKLMIVKGTPEQIKLVFNIVSEMEKTLPAKPFVLENE
jgi:hypothetical protein